jgi:hypothetical protein
MSKLQEMPSALKREHQKTKFCKCFALLFPDPDCKSGYGSGLRIQIRIRIANPYTDPDCKSVYGSGLRIRIRIANPDTDPDCESGHGSGLRIRTREGERHCTSMTISYTESILCVKGYHVGIV